MEVPGDTAEMNTVAVATLSLRGDTDEMDPVLARSLSLRPKASLSRGMGAAVRSETELYTSFSLKNKFHIYYMVKTLPAHCFSWDPTPIHAHPLPRIPDPPARQCVCGGSGVVPLPQAHCFSWDLTPIHAHPLSRIPDPPAR